MSKVTRTFRGAAARTALTGSMSATVPSAGGQFAVQNAAGWPSANFVVMIDRGAASMEKVLVASRTANVCTVATSGRGFDGTTAVAHNAGAYVEHVLDAATLTALLEHVNTDAGFDHTAYLKLSNVGTLADLTNPVIGDTAAAGSTGRWVLADHAHPFAQPPAFRLRTTSTRSVPATAANVTWDAADLDTHSGWTTDHYTIPTGWQGLWLLSTTIEMDGNTTGTRYLNFVSGSTVLVPMQVPALNTATVTECLASTSLVRLTAGVQIGVRISSTQAGLNTATTNTYFAGVWIEP